MHPNPIYRTDDRARILDLAAERGFGLLSINGAEAPLIAHVPFVVEGGRVLFHLVRSNPVAMTVTCRVSPSSGSMPEPKMMWASG